MYRSLFAVSAALVVASSAVSQEFPRAWADQLQWRSIGPATMGGRIIGLAVYEQGLFMKRWFWVFTWMTVVRNKLP